MMYFKDLRLSRRALFSVAGALLFVLSISIILYSCSARKTSDHEAFNSYIESYTAGVISKESTILIKLAGEVQTIHAQNEVLENGVFDISPSVKGKAYWLDAQTIAFKPASALDPDKNYTVDFNLGKLIKVPEDFEHFVFDFQTIRPDFKISFDGLQTATALSLDKMKLSGSIQTADAEDGAKIEKLLQADYSPAAKISWRHNPATKTHDFVVNNLARASSGTSTLNINWDGAPLNIGRKGHRNFEIPAAGDFKLLAIRPVQEQEQYVLYQFSNPIRIGQELNGLMGINTVGDMAYTIDGSQVKLYAPEHLQGNYTAFLNEVVKDIAEKKISRNFTANIFFENRMPAVTIPGKGVILPQTGKLTMPFEAVNLNAVDVSIIRIYENNVPQYFQNNGFDGEQQLRMVGRPVVQKTIRLDGNRALNLHKKNRFMLDIDHLIRTEPGAIYRVVIGFRQSYSLYDCSKDIEATENDGDNEDDGEYYEDEYYGGDGSVSDEDDDFWKRYDNYYPKGYRWNDKGNACSISYYTRDKWATRNIIASNIGLITKRGGDNSMMVVVTNILDAQPMPGVELQLLDYQKQVIHTATSDGDGFASFTLKRKPYLLIAKKGDERGYLKLDDGSALPLSRFDVSGDQVQKGLKGFIYGERGVWRPGDSIFLSFILEDKLKTLPADHPVEFELYNPQGQLYKRMIQTNPVDGFYAFRTATGSSSPTGTWSAKVKVGGALFEKSLKVETIMPNRLKINLSFGNQAELTKGSSRGLLTAKWLFGGIAQNLKAKVDAFLSPQTTSFKNFEKYVFDDPTLQFNTQTQTVFDGRLNAAGTAIIDADVTTEKQAPGQLKANFLVKVFEPGGNFSIQQLALPYNVYPGYVGVKVPEGSDLSGMLTTGKDHFIDIADVDVNGRPFAGRRDVEIELFKIQWRWWWDQTGEELSNFTQDQYNKLVKTEMVSLNNGMGRWKMNIGQADWGRYLIKVKDPKTGHSTGKVIYIDWPNWAERLQQDNPTEAAMLSFTSDKTSYKVGEEASLTIPTGAGGRALVSFENGSKVVKAVWIDTKKGQTRYSFKVDENMAPNVFVNVTLLQRHSQTVNDLPIRMYGAIPLKIDNPATVLNPLITMPDKIRPQTSSEITVSESTGKEMTYTIAIVDEGILDLTNFKTPDPHQTFYAREALGVRTWDLFDYIIGAYGSGLQRILSIGGDAALGTNKNVAVNRFKPVVKFMGPFHLSKGEKQTKRFTLPQYIGSVRAMVIAGHDGNYGFTEKTVAVKKPLMILATLPRVLGPSEKFQLPVTVFAMEKNIRAVTLRLQSNTFGAALMEKTIQFNKPGDQLVSFDMDVKNMVGTGRVRITAQSGSETAVEDVELSIRNPNPAVTSVMEKVLRPGEAWNTAYKPVGMAGTNRATLEVSAIPPLNLAKRMDYLIHYPYGCVEQTTSSGFPQLYLSQLMELNPKQQAEVQRNIKSTIARLNGFQLPGGGLTYWPGSGTPDEWGTNYAGHFMLAAQAKGYALPVGFIDNWKKYQQQKARNWAPNTERFYGDDLTQAYRLYLLALAREPELGAMNRLKEFKYLGQSAKWRLAAAYKLAGQPEVALQMIAGLSTEVKPYNQLYGTYGSDLRDEAMILETLTLLGRFQKATQVMRSVAAQLSRDSWYSTQTTAYSLLALAQYCGQDNSGNKLMFSYRTGRSTLPVTSSSFVWQGNLAANGGNALLKNTSQKVLYIKLVQQGQPAPGQERAVASNPGILIMQVNYQTMAGKPVDVAALKQGTDFMARVSIRNPGGRGRYDNLALTQMFPSGWEILNIRMLNNEKVFKSSAFDYQDIRDDRVYTYFSLNETESVNYYVMLTAAYSGRYYLPATYCEAMYDHSINAIAKGNWVNVIR